MSSLIIEIDPKFFKESEDYLPYVTASQINEETFGVKLALQVASCIRPQKFSQQG